jgi:Holliday junction resolvase-like predicted endonuclease
LRGAPSQRFIGRIEPWALRLCPELWLRRTVAQGKPDRGQLGRIGEALAERAARRRGWRLVGRDVPGPPAQIDLLFRDGRRLELIEVKTRRSPRGRPLDLPVQDWISEAQVARLRAAALALGAAPGAARLHLVEVQLVGPGWRPELRWRRLDT